tara:strand:+ start:20090 stop:21208 length:1119 start_codon:yes stop_codon:yes gene_type:complete
MIKVLHFFKTYYPDTMGGIEQVVFQLAEGAEKFDIDASVLTLSTRGSFSNQQVGTHRVYYSKLTINPASTGISISVIKEFRRLAKEADIIHYHFPWPFMDLLHFICGVRKPTVVTYHSDVVKQKLLLHFYTPLMHKFLSRVDAIVASSPNYVESSSVLARYRSKVSVIPFGLDPSTYPSVCEQKVEAWKDRIGNKVFLFVGALRYYKGLDYLLEACALNDFSVAIVGGGPEEKALKQKISSLRLENRVHMIGRVEDEDKVALLSMCYGFVFPSHLRSEAFGMSLLEASMFGKPMISCEIGTGMSFINQNGVTGITIPPEDSQALASAMDTMWNNEADALSMGENALKRFNEMFRSEKMLQSYSNVYKRLVRT